jgi:hypothetical protein
MRLCAVSDAQPTCCPSSHLSNVWLDSAKMGWLWLSESVSAFSLFVVSCVFPLLPPVKVHSVCGSSPQCPSVVWRVPPTPLSH